MVPVSTYNELKKTEQIRFPKWYTSAKGTLSLHKKDKMMITAFISVKEVLDSGRNIVSFYPLTVPETDIDSIVEMLEKRHGKAHVTVKRGEELKKSIECQREIYEVMGKILKERIQ